MKLDYTYLLEPLGIALGQGSFLGQPDTPQIYLMLSNSLDISVGMRYGHDNCYRTFVSSMNDLGYWLVTSVDTFMVETPLNLDAKNWDLPIADRWKVLAKNPYLGARSFEELMIRRDLLG